MPTTTTEFEEVDTAFALAFKTLDTYEREHPSDESYVDAAGLMREVAAEAANRKRALVSEIPTGVTKKRGDVFELYQPEPTIRSFSAPAIFKALLKASDDTLSELIMMLIERGALRLTWQYTKLRSVLHMFDVPVVIKPREIDDTEMEALIGEHKKLGSPQLNRFGDTSLVGGTHNK
jgi:hypothetical protein